MSQVELIQAKTMHSPIGHQQSVAKSDCSETTALQSAKALDHSSTALRSAKALDRTVVAHSTRKAAPRRAASRAARRLNRALVSPGSETEVQYLQTRPAD